MSKNEFQDCKRQMKTASTEECFAPHLSRLGFAFEAECHKFCGFQLMAKDLN